MDINVKLAMRIIFSLKHRTFYLTIEGVQASDVRGSVADDQLSTGGNEDIKDMFRCWHDPLR
jgi:hypothetical protein